MVARARAHTLRTVAAVVAVGLLWLTAEVAAVLVVHSWADRRQLLGAQRLTVALETFRPSSRAGLSTEVAVAELAPDRAVRSDPAWCTPLSLLAVKGALGGESWTGVNGSPDQPVTTLTVRYADAARARHELLSKRVALARCSAVRLTFPPFDQPAEDFDITGRQWAAFAAGDRLAYALVGHGTRYDFYIRSYANTLTWTYGDDHARADVRRQVVDDLISRFKELSRE
jgi:hypothetical protein